MSAPYLRTASGLVHRRAGCPHATKAARRDDSELVSADRAIGILEAGDARLCGSCASWEPFVDSLRTAARKA